MSTRELDPEEHEFRSARDNQTEPMDEHAQIHSIKRLVDMVEPGAPASTMLHQKSAGRAECRVHLEVERAESVQLSPPSHR